MNWLLFAIIGHVANGAAFVIDKALLSTSFKRSATYAGMVGILSTAVVAAIPWVETWPIGFELFLAIVSGVTFIFALRAFFGALSRSEASRVVPIVSALIPVLTLIGTVIFLGERLSPTELAGFAILILATILLSSSGKHATASRQAVVLAVASAVLFAISFVTSKYVYDAVGFLSGFVTTRLAAGGTAIIMVTLLDPSAGRELLTILRPKKHSKQPKYAAGLAVLGQSLGAVGFLFVQLGIARGSAAIVNALQAVQFGFLMLAAFLLRRRAPHLLNESFDRRTILMKTAALAMIAIGLACIV